MTTASDPWGRVDDDGTVYVKTAEGERVVGSWQAGSPTEALAFFQRKYLSLETEVSLLEQRISTTDLSPAQAKSTITRLLESVSCANCVGDLDGLRGRLEALTGLVDHRREENKAAREQARSEAQDRKTKIVEEAERIAAEATHWKISGERMRQLLEEWKAAPRADRATETVLWKRLSAARNAFTKRRKAYFASLEDEREAARTRKEQLVTEAEALSGSTDWGPTASAYRDLMRQWKEAGRADRAAEEELWGRFKAAQDTFFGARDEAMAAQDSEFAANAEAKEKLLAEAEQLVPVTDVEGAKRAIREIAERWDAIGKVPRDQIRPLEDRMRAVEQAIRGIEEEKWRRTDPEKSARADDMVAKLHEAIGKVEADLDRARSAGDQKKVTELEENLASRRAFLEMAERASADYSG